ncbi:MAG: DUF192 domain-containing protein [Pseudomonadota bacterium]
MRHIIAAALVFMASPTWACTEDLVSLRGDWGNARFSVEIADDAAERSRGLMFREAMPRSAGMLFLYERPQRVSFWMKNTLIPLDMIFLDETGTVKRVHSNAIPGDLTSIPGGDNIIAVLEINGGLSETFGINEGSQMQHPFFAANPVWPCEE